MSYTKNYLFDLADRLGKDINDITELDMENDTEGLEAAKLLRLNHEAQAIWGNKESTDAEKQNCKGDLRKVTIREILSSYSSVGVQPALFVSGDVLIRIPPIGSKEEYHYVLLID